MLCYSSQVLCINPHKCTMYYVAQVCTSMFCDLSSCCLDLLFLDIWPQNPLIATRGSIIISCSVTRSATEDTVNQPYFVFNDSLEVTNSTLQVVQLNFSLVQLYLANAQRDMSGLIECQLNESSTFISDFTFLTVAGKNFGKL